MKTILFVASRSALGDGKGGVQQCTLEYIAVLKAAGFNVETVHYDSDMSVLGRARRRLFNRPYTDRVDKGVVASLTAASVAHQPEFVFFNQADVLAFSKQFRAELPNTKLILLSHGLESTDFLHECRARGYGGAFDKASSFDIWRLGYQLMQEAKQRECLDGVVCLSSVECEIERWLGAKRVHWLPRVVAERPLAWNPVRNRVGFVGTIDHPPNAEGLVLSLRALRERAPQIRVRIVGGPMQMAKDLLSSFPNVEYLGFLDDHALRVEASTWNCFLHPLFCFARGASTKLATGLSWGIPIVSTPSGCRGYRWSEGGILQAHSAPDFADKVANLCSNASFAQEQRSLVTAAARTSPTIADVTAELSNFLSTFNH